jgi:hypothetical protein
MNVEITAGPHEKRIGKLIEQTPLFDTVEIIIEGFSCYTEEVYLLPEQWKTVF